MKRKNAPASLVCRTITSRPALHAAAQLGGHRRVAPDLAVQRKILDDAAAPRHLGVDAAQRLAIEAGHRTELEVDVEVEVLGLALGIGLLAGDRRFEEAAAVEHVAAYRRLHHAVGPALRLQRGLVAFRRRIGREVRIDEIAVLVDFQRSLDRDAAAIDHDILEASRLRLLHHVEGHLARFAGGLTQPGSKLSSFSAVRSASTPILLS